MGLFKRSSKALTVNELRRLRRMVFNARVGDGGVYQNGRNYYLLFMTTAVDLLGWKRSQIPAALHPSNFKLQSSGYGGKKQCWYFSTRNSSWVTYFVGKPLEELLPKMGVIDFYLWFLDDGSFHQRKRFSHLYCNSLTVEQIELLIQRISELFKGNRAKLRWDRKLDGRAYPYIYLPVNLTASIRPGLLEFMRTYDITSLRYKLGVTPSTTIEKTPKLGGTE